MLTVSAKIIKNTINYGNLITRGSKVSSIVEKPVRDLKINAGIYVVNPKIKKFLKKYLSRYDKFNKFIGKTKS